jgi:hypothetical protein
MTTWNPADAGAGITFSNGNLTVTAPSAGTRSVRGTTSKTAGKWYFEVKSTGSIGNCGIGIANAAADMTTTATTGASFVNVGNGLIFNNGSNLGSFFTAWVVNDVCCVALDLIHRSIWFRKNSGNWNGTAGNDPTTNVGGTDLSWFALGTLIFPVCAFNTVAAMSEVADFGASVNLYTIPTGFSFWDAGAFAIHPFV